MKRKVKKKKFAYFYSSAFRPDHHPVLLPFHPTHNPGTLRWSFIFFYFLGVKGEVMSVRDWRRWPGRRWRGRLERQVQRLRVSANDRQFRLGTGTRTGVMLGRSRGPLVVIVPATAARWRGRAKVERAGSQDGSLLLLLSAGMRRRRIALAGWRRSGWRTRHVALHYVGHDEIGAALLLGADHFGSFHQGTSQRRVGRCQRTDSGRQGRRQQGSGCCCWWRCQGTAQSRVGAARRWTESGRQDADGWRRWRRWAPRWADGRYSHRRLFSSFALLQSQSPELFVRFVGFIH